MVTDPIADLLTRIRNACTAGHPELSIPASKTKERILRVLKEEGYIDSFETNNDARGRAVTRIVLRYGHRGEPVIRELKRISTPGKRRFVTVGEVPRSHGGLGVVVVSTSRGMVSDSEARKLGVGGELICSVF